MDDEVRYGSGAAVHAERASHQWEGETATDRQPEAREAMDRLFMGAEAIHSQIGSLEERLHDLLGPERPDKRDTEGVRPISTPFGGKLHQVADQLAAADRRLGDLLDRLRDGI